MNSLREKSNKLLVNRIIFFNCLIISFNSCSINGTMQGLYSYYSKTSEIFPLIIKKPFSSICDIYQKDTSFIYTINGIEIKSCIKKIKRTLLYLWKPKCTSDNCLSLGKVQEYCNENNIELFIVAEYYDYETMKILHLIKRPIFGIDCEYYKTNMTKKYLNSFMNDLLGEKINLNGNSYFFFKNGCLDNMSEDLSKINTK
jgi:hypothetical protein